MTVDQALNELDQDSCAALANWQAGWVQQEKDEQVGNIFSFGSQSVRTRNEECKDLRANNERSTSSQNKEADNIMIELMKVVAATQAATAAAEAARGALQLGLAQQ
jgi:hypothetical protein